MRSASTSTHFDLRAFTDSLRAQEIADLEGPRVSIRAEITSFASMRRVRTSFRMEDDAYVLVGHLGPDGVVRIIFPADPSDNGLVQGGKSYRLPEVSAGFYDQYRWRNAQFGMFRSTAARTDSYDGGTGYVFVIAAWRPMRLDRFSQDGRWDSFEVTDEMYMRDPRPAIYELATLLTGENREAYTVKFASYFSSANSYGFGRSMFSSAYCLGYEPLGYSVFGYSDGPAYIPRGPFNNMYSGYLSYGSLRYAYRYDASQGCYRTYMIPMQTYATGPGGVPRFAPKDPFVPKDTNTAGPDSSGNARPVPIGGNPPRVRESPIQPKDVMPGTEVGAPEYRRRGLVTADESDRAGGPGRRSNGGWSNIERPPIQDLVNRRRDGERSSADAAGYRPTTPRLREPNGRQVGERDYTNRVDSPRRAEPRTQNETGGRPAEPAPSVRPEPPRAEPVRVESRPPEPARPPEPRPAAETPRVESRPPAEPSAPRPITPR